MIGPFKAHERMGNYLESRAPAWKHYPVLVLWLLTGAVFWLTLALLAIAALAAVILAIVKPVAEADCNQRGDQLSVADADYRLLSDTCYLTLDSGEVIPADQYRATEAVER